MFKAMIWETKTDVSNFKFICFSRYAKSYLMIVIIFHVVMSSKKSLWVLNLR